MKIPESYKTEVEARIQEQIQAEVAGDIAALYDFILPAIRDKRERERSDEPELSKTSIAKFSASVETAKLETCQIVECHPTSKIYGVSPAVKVEYSICYNQRTSSSFSALWVKHEDKWCSTSLDNFRMPENA